MTTDRQEVRRLAVYLRATFPEVDTTAPVDAAIWLLEHLHRIETMQPPLLWTLHTCQQAEKRVQACVS